jgi:hypothetical protein
MEGAAGRHAIRTSLAQLFGDWKCTATVLEFLATAEVGMRGRSAGEERIYKEDGRVRAGKGRARTKEDRA